MNWARLPATGISSWLFTITWALGCSRWKKPTGMLNETHPDYVFLNYDCGHFRFAGEDPVAALKKYISRTAHVHLKDIRPKVLRNGKATKK